MRQKSFTTQAIILKRKNLGEADRLVTLMTASEGKIVCIAKGVRKISSSKRAYLEPGNLIHAFLINTKSLPLLTQAKLIREHPLAKSNLKKIRQLTQVLEIIDRLFVEGVSELILFEKIKNILKLLNSPKNNQAKIKQELQKIIEQLGFLSEDNKNLLETVAAITDKPMKSWRFLKV